MTETVPALPVGSRLDVTGDRTALLFVQASPASQWLQARNLVVGLGWRFHPRPGPVEDGDLGRVLRYELAH
jgi:hypothetical protein